jgi:DNA-binding CsgD family transcriptional regulator
LTHNVRLDSVAVSAHGHLYLSYTANLRGDVEDERLHVTHALDAMRQMGDLLAVPEWLWAGCALALSEGRPHAALRLAGGADALGRRGGSHLNDQFMNPLRTRVEEAQREVGVGRAERLEAEGAEMTLEDLLAEAVGGPGRGGPLSPREREVAALVGEGLTNTEIAARLYISKRTVESHVDHIKQKLDLGSRAQVVAWAIREVLEPPE